MTTNERHGAFEAQQPCQAELVEALYFDKLNMTIVVLINL